MNKISKWIDENEDTLMQVFAFGCAIALALCMMSLRFFV